MLVRECVRHWKWDDSSLINDSHPLYLHLLVRCLGNTAQKNILQMVMNGTAEKDQNWFPYRSKSKILKTLVQWSQTPVNNSLPLARMPKTWRKSGGKPLQSLAFAKPLVMAFRTGSGSVKQKHSEGFDASKRFLVVFFNISTWHNRLTSSCQLAIKIYSMSK